MIDLGDENQFSQPTHRKSEGAKEYEAFSPSPQTGDNISLLGRTVIYFKMPHIESRGRNRLDSERWISPVYTHNSSISSAGSKPQTITNSQAKVHCPKAQKCPHLDTQLQTLPLSTGSCLLLKECSTGGHIPYQLSYTHPLVQMLLYTTGFFFSHNSLWLKNQSKQFQLVSRSYKGVSCASWSLHSVTTGNQSSYTVKRQGSFSPNSYFACFLQL